MITLLPSGTNMSQSQNLFEEFIQFAYKEMNVPKWRERMNDLCGGIVEELDKNDRRNMTIPELLDYDDDFEMIMTIIFKENALEHYWFKSWIEANNPENEFSWELRDEFCSFLYGLSFQEMIELF